MSVRKLKCEVVVPFTANPKVDRKGMRAFCVGLSRGSMAAACPSGSLLDLSPRATCVSSEPPLDSMQGGTLQFDKLVGSQSNPAHLFTCTRGYHAMPKATNLAKFRPPGRLRRWPPRSLRGGQRLSMRDAVADARRDADGWPRMEKGGAR